MNDFKLKLILSVLGGVIFSFIFIFLTFTLPIKNKETALTLKPKGMLQQVSHGLKN